MITASELYPIGYVAKTHGIKGELNVALDTPYEPADFKFLVFEIDSIYVPFVITNTRGQGVANRLVSLKGIDSVEEARELAGKTAYVLVSELKNQPDYDNEADVDGIYLSDLVGYCVTDENGNHIGTISGFNDDTQNYLLEIKNDEGKVLLIPYVDDWVVDFDSDKRTISFNLPTGLLD